MNTFSAKKSLTVAARLGLLTDAVLVSFVVASELESSSLSRSMMVLLMTLVGLPSVASVPAVVAGGGVLFGELVLVVELFDFRACSSLSFLVWEYPLLSNDGYG
jgi:hypothetical protein